jgi:hypothetical protein
MCPFCFTTVVLIAVSASSVGGLAALVAKRRGKTAFIPLPKAGAKH